MNTPGGVNTEAWSQVRMGSQGAVVSNHPLSSLAGMKMLMNGGNAVDAAVAIGFALGVVEPQGSGIASDGFIMVHNKESGTISVANGTGYAPMAATPERFKNGLEVSGILSVSVPGLCDALLSTHERYGRLPLKECVAPAIEWCLEGVPQTHYQYKLALKCDLLHEFPASAEIFAPGGQPLRPGEIRRNPDLARTYQLIADHGRDAFYTGPIADALIKFSDDADGILTKEDIARYNMVWQDPISTTYRGRTVYEAPPNSSGHALLQSLNLIEHFDMASLGLNSAEGIHVMVEAKKLAFADREAFLADPDFVDVPIEGLISKEYAADRVRLIELGQAAEYVSAGNPWAYQDQPTGSKNQFKRSDPKPRELHSDTTHYCVIDRWGNAVDGLQSLSSNFGSQIVCPGTGMLLNNRMNYWHLDADHVDCLQPGKRVRHTMNPVMIFNAPPEAGGTLDMCCGTPGADTQVQSNMQFITAIYDHDCTVTEAIHAPRWTHSQERTDSMYPHKNENDLIIETRIDNDVVEKLQRFGHPARGVGPWDGKGSVGAIRVDTSGSLSAAADPRRDGQALVY